MKQIASQSLGKSYVSDVLSRSFFVSYFCYILILIIPATILINIQYSWPSYKRQLIQPLVTYQGFQLSCIDNTNKIIYNSNFQSSLETKDNTATLSLGLKGSKIYLTGQIYSPGIKACSAQIYIKAKIGTSVQSIQHFPLNIAVPNDAHFLSSSQIKGTLRFKSSIPIPQTSILAYNETNFGTYPFSFSSDFRSAGDKVIILDSNILYNKISTTTLSTQTFTFTGEFQILSDTYFLESSLIDKLRTFVPIFMYLCLFIWWVVIDPLINWMLSNKIYSARKIYDKIKKD